MLQHKLSGNRKGFQTVYIDLATLRYMILIVLGNDLFKNRLECFFFQDAYAACKLKSPIIFPMTRKPV